MTDPSWLAALRAAHVIFGAVAFVMAPAALLTIKGGDAHRRWGKIYFWSMMIVTVSALVAALRRPNWFLAFASLFSFYLAFRGYRVLRRKQARPALVDWVLVAATVLVNLLLVVLGLARVWDGLGAVAVVFGAAGVAIASIDLKAMLVPPADRRHWWYAHMIGMIGSYLAALSAFSVTTMSFLPALVRWLWPAAIGLPLLALWVRHYRLKFAA